MNSTPLEKPLSKCSLYCLLEHELLLQRHEASTFSQSVVNFQDYADLESQFPPLPLRYQSLILPVDWFLRRKKIKRIRFSDSIVHSWNTVNPELRVYFSTVAAIIKHRYDQIQVVRELVKEKSKRDQFSLARELLSNNINQPQIKNLNSRDLRSLSVASLESNQQIAQHFIMTQPGTASNSRRSQSVHGQTAAVNPKVNLTQTQAGRDPGCPVALDLFQPTPGQAAVLNPQVVLKQAQDLFRPTSIHRQLNLSQIKQEKESISVESELKRISAKVEMMNKAAHGNSNPLILRQPNQEQEAGNTNEGIELNAFMQTYDFGGYQEQTFQNNVDKHPLNDSNVSSQGGIGFVDLDDNDIRSFYMASD